MNVSTAEALSWFGGGEVTHRFQSPGGDLVAPPWPYRGFHQAVSPATTSKTTEQPDLPDIVVARGKHGRADVTKREGRARQRPEPIRCRCPAVSSRFCRCITPKLAVVQQRADRPIGGKGDKA
jgi:hypothetical protein